MIVTYCFVLSYTIISLFLDLGEMHTMYDMRFLLCIACALTLLFYESD